MEEIKDTPGVSPEGKVRRNAAGSVNLAQSRSKAYRRAHDLEQEVSAYRDALLASAGPDPSPTKVGYITAAVATYASLRQLTYDTLRSSKSERVDLTERISWLTGNLYRLLKALNLDAKPRPKTLADIDFGPPTEKQ